MAGKTFDTFAPTGPELVSPDEVPDPHNLGIRLRLNGQTMQDSNTKPADLRSRRADRIPVADHDARARRPDLHGNPSRRGDGPKAPVWLKPGDVVEVEIDQLGTLRNTVVAEDGER